jgi:hypothetical protein
MDSLDLRLEKRRNAGIYGLMVLTVCLGVCFVVDSCKVKTQVNLKAKDNHYGIALRTKAH